MVCYAVVTLRVKVHQPLANYVYVFAGVAKLYVLTAGLILYP